MKPADLRLPPFTERPPWIGGDLQSIRSRLYPAPPPAPDATTERIEIATRDGSGDRLFADIDRPREPTGMTVLLLHGLAGSADSRYMRSAARSLVACGHIAVRLNLRGAGPSARVCRHRYHAGRTADLRDAIAGLPPALAGRGIGAIGFSLGGNALLKLLGETGAAAPIRLAVSVSAPIDLAAACACIDRPRNRLYRAYLLGPLRADARARTPDPRVRAAIDRIGTIRAFDDLVTAPDNGFRDAADYYARNSALVVVGQIAVPTIMIQAVNDPWVPSESYRRAAAMVGPAARVVLLPGGGHVGFHGRGSVAPWFERVAGAFFAQAMAA